MVSNKETVTIIDYEAGNLGSIVNMFKRIGVPCHRTQDPKDVETATKIVLPGVGAFDHCVKNMEKFGFRDVLNKRVLEDRVPILGVCVGFQMMSEQSEEGQCKGFGWLKGTTEDMRTRTDKTREKNLKFPHIGWNFIDEARAHPVLGKLPDPPRFYFVHTYRVACENDSDVIATTEYGDLKIVASAGHDNIIGTQFHPEKSHKYGIQLFKNFSEWVPES